MQKNAHLRKKRVLSHHDLVGNGGTLPCMATVKNLLGTWKHAWKRTLKGACSRLGKETRHGDMGRSWMTDFSSGNAGAKTLIDFLDDTGDMHGEPCATRMIGELTGKGIR